MVDGQMRTDVGGCTRIGSDSRRLVIAGILSENDIMTWIYEERRHGSDGLKYPIADVIGFL